MKFKRLLSIICILVILVSSVPIQTLAAETTDKPVVTIESDFACVGQTVDIDVSISGNTGIFGAILTFEFPAQLELKQVTNGNAFADLDISLPDSLTSPYTVFYDGAATPSTTDGIILTMSFLVTETADVDMVHQIKASYLEGDVTDSNLQDLDIDIVNGGVYVVDYIPGDVNGDGRVNTVDVTLIRRYRIGGYDLGAFREAAADVNDDGRINTVDVTLIRRFRMGGYGVVLIPSTHWHTHALIAVAEKPASCDADGNIAYWQCSRCEKYFSDAEGKVAITLADTVVKMPHTLIKTEAKANSCTADGNIAYWQCSKCNKYFSNAEGTNEIELADTVVKAAHTLTKVEAKESTFTATGNKLYWQCSVCHKFFIDSSGITETTWDDIVIPILKQDTTTITYDLYGSDKYLQSVGVKNTNPTTFDSADGLILNDLVGPKGYTFTGWKTSSGVVVDEIEPGSARQMNLNASWVEDVFTITYKLYQTPIENTIEDKYKSYTVSKGLIDLPNPTIYNYVFLGWYLDDGTEVTSIPVGTTGDITLNAYWTSKRNLAKKVQNIGEPLICEDFENGVIYFAYELGTIENVPILDADGKPIWTIQGVSGLAQQKSETITHTISEARAEEVAEAIANATVDSGTWTLSNEWTESTNVNEKWAEEHGTTTEVAKEQSMSKSNTLSIVDSTGGKSTKTTTDGTTAVTYDSKTTTKETGSHFDVSVNAKYSNSTKVSAGVKVPLGIAEVNAGVENTSTFEIGGGVGYGNYDKNTVTKHTGTDTTKINTTVEEDSKSWNNESTASSTATASESLTVSKAMSQIISTEKGYGKTYAYGGEGSETQGISNTASKSTTSSSVFTYTSAESVTTTSTYSTDGKTEGWYRLVIAGTIHVFGVVGYDVASKSFFTYTYNVMDDKTSEFLDYSPVSSFDDCQHGALPFEIPYFVCEYVNNATAKTNGLKFSANSIEKTAIVSNYEGTDIDVAVPTYYSAGGMNYRVTGISKEAFAGKPIRSIILSEYIDEIPDGAFKDCTALEEINGRFTKIGEEAFSGCTALENFNVAEGVSVIGANAFLNVKQITVNALNAYNATKLADSRVAIIEGETAENRKMRVTEEAKKITQEYINSAVTSGAKNIVMNIESIIDGAELSINAPEMESFELQGGIDKNIKKLKNLKFKSNAAKTIIRQISVENSSAIPFEISSDELTLNTVTVKSEHFAMLLLKDGIKVTLIKDNRFSSEGGFVAICKNATFISESVESAVGEFFASGNIYYCGTIDGTGNLIVSSGYELKSITEEEFNSMVNSHYVRFNANGGTVTESKKLVKWNLPIGELPVPTKDGFTFDGWFTGDGTQITADTVFTSLEDLHVKAYWTSGWVLASNLPEDAQVVEQKWSYTKTETIESNNSSMSGWTQTGVDLVESGSGSSKYAVFPTGYNTNNEYYTSFSKTPYSAFEDDTTKREVTKNKEGYIYWHWMYDVPYANSLKRAISNRTGFWDKYGNNSANAYSYKYFSAFTSAVDCPYIDNLGCCSQNLPTYDCSGYIPNTSIKGIGTPRYFRFEYYTITYTDYQKVYKYEKETTGLETSEYAYLTSIASDTVKISDETEYVRYRIK